MDRILQHETGNGIANTNEPKFKRSTILVNCLDDILSLLEENEVKTLFIKSPLYNPGKSRPNPDTRHIDPVITGAVSEAGYPFRDNTYLNVIADHKTYFADGAHLSDIGSEAYSKYISAVIDSLI